MPSQRRVSRKQKARSLQKYRQLAGWTVPNRIQDADPAVTVNENPIIPIETQPVNLQSIRQTDNNKQQKIKKKICSSQNRLTLFENFMHLFESLTPLRFDIQLTAHLSGALAHNFEHTLILPGIQPEAVILLGAKIQLQAI